MKKTMKKIVALVCVLALSVTSVSFGNGPKSVEATDRVLASRAVYLDGFRNLTTSSFVDGSGNQMEEKRHEVTTVFSMKDMQGNTDGTYDKTLLSLQVLLEAGNMNSRIEIAGKDYTSAFMLYTNDTGSELIFSQTKWTEGSCMAADPFFRMTALAAGVETFLKDTFLLQMSFDYGNYDTDELEDDVKIGFYINGKLYNNQHHTVYNCNIDTVFGDCLTVYCDGGAIMLEAVVPEKDDLELLTWSDYVVAGTKEKVTDTTFEPSESVSIYQLKNLDITNMESTAFESKFTFEKSGFANAIRFAGKNTEYGIFILVGNNENLWISTNGAISPDLGLSDVLVFDKEIAEVGTFLNSEFTLRVSIEFADYDGDGDAKDVQLGFYFNGKLYNNQYLYSYDCKEDFGPYLSVYPGSGTISIHSVEKPIEPIYLEGFRNVTTSSFANTSGEQMQTGRYEGTYVFGMKDMQGSVEGTFDRTLLSLKVKYEAGSTSNRIEVAGKNTSSAFMLYTNEAGSELIFSQINWSESTRMAEDPFKRLNADTAGVEKFLNKEFLLQMSFEYGNYDSDNIEDDVKIGFYINGVLYNNQHHTVYNCNIDSVFGNCLTMGCYEGAISVDAVVPVKDDLTTITWSDYVVAGTQNKATDTTFEVSVTPSIYQLQNQEILHMESTSFETKLTFEQSLFSNVVRIAGKNAEYGLFLLVGNNENLWLSTNSAVSPDLGLSDVLVFDKEIAGVNSFLNKEFKFKMTTEFADYDGDGDSNDVQLGFYFNGTLYNSQYLYGYDCKADFGPYVSVYPGTGAIAIKSTSIFDVDESPDDGGDNEGGETPGEGEDEPVAPEVGTPLSDFRKITLTSFVDAYGAVMESKRYEETAVFTMRDMQGNMDGTFKRTLLSMKLKFEEGGMASRVELAGRSESSCFMLHPNADGTSFVFSQTNWVEGVRMAEDPYRTFSAETAGVTSFVDKEFLLQMSFEYGDYDNDGAEDDLKLGMYFDGALYNSAYTIIPNCSFDTAFGDYLTVRCDGAPITVTSVVPQANELTEITWSDFVKSGTQKATTEQLFPATSGLQNYQYNNTEILNMDSVSFEAKYLFEKIGFEDVIRYGGIKTEYGIFIMVGNEGNLWIHTDSNVSPNLGLTDVLVLDKAIAGVDTFLNQEFTLKITTEFADFDGDNDANDVQLGFYINGRLYNDQYLYGYDCKEDFGPHLSVYPGTGNVMIRSVKNDYEVKIRHLYEDGVYEINAAESQVVFVNGVVTQERTISVEGDYLIALDNGNNITERVILYSEGDAHPDGKNNVKDLVAVIKARSGKLLANWAGALGIYTAGLDVDIARQTVLDTMVATEISNAVTMNFIGEDVMPLGGYCGPHRAYQDEERGLTELYPDFITDEYYQYISDAGINLISYSEENYNYSDGSNVKKMLELGKKYGIGHFVTDSDITSRIGIDECDDVVIANGVATIKDAASLRATDSTDLDITGEMTIFMKVKVNQILANDGLLSKGPITGGAYAVGVSDKNYGWWFSNRGYKWSGDGFFPTEEWRELAVVITYDSNNMNIAHYLSTDSTTGITSDCKTTTNTLEGITGMTPNNNALYIGNYTIHGLTSTTAIREYDDIRIYNKALTAAQLASITPNTSDTDEVVADALIAHWDFENDGTEGSELKDKATSGVKADNLAIYDANGTLYKKSDVTLATLKERIANYSTYDSFCGLYLVDEPTTEYFMPGNGTKNISNYKELAKVLQYDLGLTCYSNMFPVWKLDTNQEKYEQYVDEFCETIKPKYLSWDNYPFESEEDLDVYFYNMSLVRERATENQIPFWATIQAGGQWNDDKQDLVSEPYYPSEGQFKWNVNTCLAFGVQGLNYFPLIQPIHFAYAPDNQYDFSRNGMIGADGRINEWYYYAQRMNKHIGEIDEVLMNAVNKGVIVSGEQATTDTQLTSCIIESGTFHELASVIGNSMIGCFNYEGKTALYVVNYDMEKAQSITLNLDNTYNVKMIQNSKTSCMNTQNITLEMAAGEGALLVIQ